MMAGFVKIDFTAGTGINRAALDAQRVADILGLTVEFSFNDVECWASPNGDAVLLAERQQEEQRRELRSPMDRRLARSL